MTKGVSQQKIAVVHNGIDVGTSPAPGAVTRAALGLDDAAFVIGTTSRLDPVKGLHHLIEAFTAVRQEIPAARLVLVGDGPYRATLQALCRARGLMDAVLFVGHQTQVGPWLSLMDCLVLPSLQECHSIGLLEAMRAGLPIVATRVGGTPESIGHEVEGMLAPPADPPALARAIGQLAASPALRERLGQAARQRFQADFTAARMLDRTAQALRRFCAHTGGGR